MGPASRHGAGRASRRPRRRLREFSPALDHLAKAFADSGFDLTELTRGIVLSRAYQLATESTASRPIGDAKAFSRATVRGLTGEQIYDSLRTAGGYPLPDAAASSTGERRFVALFQSERAGIAQRSVIQALALMNGGVVDATVDPNVSPAVRAADAPFFNNSGRVDLLFLSALGRFPTAEERQLILKHVARGERTGERRRALADVFWALLNTAEFATNH